MEIQTRRQRAKQIANQENVYAIEGKAHVQMPTKRQGLTLRGALGEMSTNVQAQQENNIAKVAVAVAEFEKKATQSRGAVRTKYSHVQSKIDTGLACKKTPLRREENTAGLAAKAVARSKDTSNKQMEIKKVKKSSQESKKVNKLPTLKESNEAKSLKPILKDSTESLGKLKLVESTPPTPKLPDDIEDIDAKDNSNPLLMSIYIKDIYRYLTELEVKYPIEENHLKKQSDITGKMRARLIDWLVEVQREFSLVLETLHLTVGIIDRYLQIQPNVQRKQFQLIGVTAMYIASKYEEIYAPDVGDFVYLTDNIYSKTDVFRCERDIMTKLGFCLARPIPLSFLRRFVKAAHGNSKNHHLAKYFVDLCLVEYSMAHYRSSELAAAATCLSLYMLSSKKLKEVWTPTLSFYSGYSLEHIEPIIIKLAQIVINIEDSKYKAVYNKYSDTSLAKVSSLPQLKSKKMYQLAKISSSYSK